VYNPDKVQAEQDPPSQQQVMQHLGPEIFWFKCG
jgi:hypothetical protein